MTKAQHLEQRTSGASLLLSPSPVLSHKIAVYITNPIFPSKALDYREMTKPIYVANQPSFAFLPPIPSGAVR